MYPELTDRLDKLVLEIKDSLRETIPRNLGDELYQQLLYEECIEYIKEELYKKNINTSGH